MHAHQQVLRIRWGERSLRHHLGRTWVGRCVVARADETCTGEMRRRFRSVAEIAPPFGVGAAFELIAAPRHGVGDDPCNIVLGMSCLWLFQRRFACAFAGSRRPRRSPKTRSRRAWARPARLARWARRWEGIRSRRWCHATGFGAGRTDWRFSAQRDAARSLQMLHIQGADRGSPDVVRGVAAVSSLHLGNGNDRFTMIGVEDGGKTFLRASSRTAKITSSSLASKCSTGRRPRSCSTSVHRRDQGRARVRWQTAERRESVRASTTGTCSLFGPSAEKVRWGHVGEVMRSLVALGGSTYWRAGSRIQLGFGLAGGMPRGYATISRFDPKRRGVPFVATWKCLGREGAILGSRTGGCAQLGGPRSEICPTPDAVTGRALNLVLASSRRSPDSRQGMPSVVCSGRSATRDFLDTRV